MFYTPPYHPELQPIEVIWGVVKNRIASAPAKSMADLDAKLGASLKKVSSRTWIGAYRKVQKQEMVKVREDQEKRRAVAEVEARAAQDAIREEEEQHEYIFQR
ncbi:hypothetical protein PR003_g22087 [Phytophthora rubi]|uniref:Tc1-like transposase DDE domain-containing protein n=1 Tax=Phytophthora rubi TaxID=129364 RepID=A0A6A4D741_9STRA|nr:hypothetical protein PR002_g21591 [Phytophthora rubi]KAE8993238.1 hypothetical protein PR001_g20721 [Phytophthora rubi]KAE9303141.1 hypothetical protein PR003_g22087 [Phytophthora rubi]